MIVTYRPILQIEAEQVGEGSDNSCPLDLSVMLQFDKMSIVDTVDYSDILRRVQTTILTGRYLYIVCYSYNKSTCAL